jgi:hypothetical protein
MTHSERAVTETFAIALAPQFAIWMLYWFFGPDCPIRKRHYFKGCCPLDCGDWGPFA